MSQDTINLTHELHAILNGIRALISADNRLDAAATSIDRLAGLGIDKLEESWG